MRPKGMPDERGELIREWHAGQERCPGSENHDGVESTHFVDNTLKSFSVRHGGLRDSFGEFFRRESDQSFGKVLNNDSENAFHHWCPRSAAKAARPPAFMLSYALVRRCLAVLPMPRTVLVPQPKSRATRIHGKPTR
jgi:hypothetical protein